MVSPVSATPEVASSAAAFAASVGAMLVAKKVEVAAGLLALTGVGITAGLYLGNRSKQQLAEQAEVADNAVKQLIADAKNAGLIKNQDAIEFGGGTVADVRGWLKGKVDVEALETAIAVFKTRPAEQTEAVAALEAAFTAANLGELDHADEDQVNAAGEALAAAVRAFEPKKGDDLNTDKLAAATTAIEFKGADEADETKALFVAAEAALKEITEAAAVSIKEEAVAILNDHVVAHLEVGFATRELTEAQTKAFAEVRKEITAARGDKPEQAKIAAVQKAAEPLKGIFAALDTAVAALAHGDEVEEAVNTQQLDGVEKLLLWIDQPNKAFEAGVDAAVKEDAGVKKADIMAALAKSAPVGGQFARLDHSNEQIQAVANAYKAIEAAVAAHEGKALQELKDEAGKYIGVAQAFFSAFDQEKANEYGAAATKEALKGALADAAKIGEAKDADAIGGHIKAVAEALGELLEARGQKAVADFQFELDLTAVGGEKKSQTAREHGAEPKLREFFGATMTAIGEWANAQNIKVDGTDDSAIAVNLKAMEEARAKLADGGDKSIKEIAETSQHGTAKLVVPVASALFLAIGLLAAKHVQALNRMLPRGVVKVLS